MGPELWNRTVVSCLAGYRADERPISFVTRDTKLTVRGIVKSWREPDYSYFRIEAEDGRVYDLRRHESEDYWEVREPATASGRGVYRGC